MDHVYSDVLVVGGGGAATRAAVEAFDSGARVILVTKGNLGAGGATGYAIADFAGLAVADGVDDPTDGPEWLLRDILQAGLGMCDATLSRILAEESVHVVPDLERWGVELERTASGKYLITQACFSSRRRNYKLNGHGRKIMEALVRQVRLRDIMVLEDAMVVDLMVDQGQVTGAVVYSKEEGWIGIHAGAVAVATGGAGQLFKRNMNPPGNTGDGYAMGFRAGAELFNMEFMQYGLGTVSPLTLFPFWLWPFKPVLKNGSGVEFLVQYLPREISADMAMEVHSGHFPFTNRLPSRYLEIAIHKELRAGRGGPKGGVWADFRGNKDRIRLTDTARKLWPTTQQWFASRGIDLDKEPVEIACFAHAMNGGFRVNEQAETSLKGLFAAGETAGGPHGADRLGGGMLTACQVFGKRAGRAAAEWAKARNHGEPRQKEFEEVVPRYEKFTSAPHRGTHSPAQIRAEIQELANKYLLLVRTEEGLVAFQQGLKEVENRLDCDCRIQDPAATMEAMEASNLLQVGRVISEAALLRRETRGSHYREDCPEMSTAAEWAIVHRGEDGHPIARFVPVKPTNT